MNMKRFAASVDSETDENIWETVEDAYLCRFPIIYPETLMNLRGEATAKRMIIFLLIRSFPWIQSHFLIRPMS